MSLARVRLRRDGRAAAARDEAVEAARAAGLADERLTALFAHQVDPEVARERLAAALDPTQVWLWAEQPALLGAAQLLARWHACGAADVLGGAVGRVLADNWFRRRGLASYPVGGIAVGFQGHRSDYKPAGSLAGDAWTVVFVRAAERAALAGLALHERIERAEGAVLERYAAARKDTLAPQIGRVLAARPAATVRQIAEALGVSDEPVRRHVNTMLRRGLIVEIAGRQKWRVIALVR
ncbi:winged helix-turn-helix domain-containing protein [Azospirillum sp. 11R-A]|uniref:winged helix-turn-helix transcriptional regulator n=1 Tax=Azospirillum sp. 11R-A TaxID=3111634 RepID=UPI003C149584